MRRLSEVPVLIKTEEIVRGSSDVPVKKKLKKLSIKGTAMFPFLRYEERYGTKALLYQRRIL